MPSSSLQSSHTIIKLTPRAYGCDEERFALPIEAVDTSRSAPLPSRSKSAPNSNQVTCKQPTAFIEARSTQEGAGRGRLAVDVEAADLAGEPLKISLARGEACVVPRRVRLLYSAWCSSLGTIVIEERGPDTSLSSPLPV